MKYYYVCYTDFNTELLNHPSCSHLLDIGIQVSAVWAPLGLRLWVYRINQELAVQLRICTEKEIYTSLRHIAKDADQVAPAVTQLIINTKRKI